MNSMDILDAIGAVDDVLLKKAKEKQKSHKAVWTAIGSLAACFLLLVTLPMAFIVFRGADSMAPECADQANGEAMGSDYLDVDGYILNPRGNTWTDKQLYADKNVSFSNYRCTMGRSHYQYAWMCRVYWIGSYSESLKNTEYGFRICRTL